MANNTCIVISQQPVQSIRTPLTWFIRRIQFLFFSIFSSSGMRPKLALAEAKCVSKLSKIEVWSKHATCGAFRVARMLLRAPNTADNACSINSPRCLLKSVAHGLRGGEGNCARTENGKGQCVVFGTIWQGMLGTQFFVCAKPGLVWV